MNWKRILIGLVVVAALVVLAFVLFGKKTIDNGDLESKLSTQVSKQAGIPADKIEMSCPSDIEVKKGKTFDCTAKAQGQDQQLTLTIELTDNDGGYVVKGSKTS